MTKQVARRRQRKEGVSQNQIEMVPLSHLKPWPGNPRINDESAKQLAVLIKEHGFVNPVVAWHNVVYAGCTRLKAAEILGLVEVPVLHVDFRDEQQAIAFALSDNRSAEWASWDDAGLADALAQLDTIDIAEVERMTGFGQEEIEGLKATGGKYADFASGTFADAVEEFEKNEGQVDKPPEYWAWFLIPGEVEMSTIKEEFSRKGGKELDFRKIAQPLGISLGEECPECEGSGKNSPTASSDNRKCARCNGSGSLSLTKIRAVRKTTRKGS